MNVVRRVLAIPRWLIERIIGSGSGGCDLPLPCSQTVNSGNTALSITNTGNGRAGYFRVNNTNNGLFALKAETNGDDAALGAFTTGSREAGYFRIDNSGNNSNALYARTNGNGGALYARTYGNGNAIMGYTGSAGGKAGLFRIDNTGNGSDALRAETTGSGWAAQFIGFGNNSKGVRIWVQNNNSPGLEVANGTKNGVVATSEGARALYAEESAEVWFCDYGFGQLQQGRARVEIDPLFAQTVNLEQPYHVFLQPYGNTNLYVSERTAAGFEVRGNADGEFSYRLVAKRRGYESLRLERTPWADTDPNLYPGRRAEWEAQFTPTPDEKPEEEGEELTKH